MRQLVQRGRRGCRKHRRERTTIPGGRRRDRPSRGRIAPTQAGSGGVRTAHRAHCGDLHRGRASFRRKLLVEGPWVRRDRVLWWSLEAPARQPALLSDRRRKAGTPGAQLGHKVEPITLCLNRHCRMIAAGCRQTRKPARGCSVRRHPADVAQPPDSRPRSARRLRGFAPRWTAPRRPPGRGAERRDTGWQGRACRRGLSAGTPRRGSSQRQAPFPRRPHINPGDPCDPRGRGLGISLWITS
jgi:hypothetical protein